MGHPSATATVSYCYDLASCTSFATSNRVGRRLRMTDAAGESSWSYDALGRVIAERRVMYGLARYFYYGYNLDGSLATLTYPSGRIITYAYNAAGRTLSAVDTANSINYATAALYAPHGALSSLKNGVVTGGFTGITTTNSYNNRLQPSVISAASALQTVLSFSYSFDQDSSPSVVKNNGNVVQIVNNRDTSRSQNFTYDELNRVSYAWSSGNLWGNQFAYDIWANLNKKLACPAGSPCVGKPQGENLDQSADTKNRFTGFCYDAAGNMNGQTACPNLSYTYDAENRITTTAGVTYTYDGDGNRVKKSNGKLYWTGTGSDPLLETDLAGNNPTEFVFFTGKRIARRDASGTIEYYFSDHLGSADVITNATGTIVDESNYYPFGGERVIVGGDPNQYKFTGKERDPESGLDYFGARYNSSSLGRLLTPDPVAGSGFNPQSLNRYAYVWNNPLRYTDPTGMVVSWEDSKAKCKKRETECRTNLQRAYESRIAKFLASKNPKEQARGRRLQSTYQRLQAAKEVFHVVRSAGDNKGELTYKGQPGHLYVEMQGSGNQYGQIPDMQKLGHEFKHGEQFLGGLLGFENTSGKWEGYRDDLEDEANAFMAGFDAEPTGPDQSDFVQGLQQAGELWWRAGRR